MRIYVLLILIVFLIFQNACSQKPIKNTKPANKLAQKSKVNNLRPVIEKKLSNGLELVLIPDSTLPRVTMMALVKVGNQFETIENAGINAMTVDMLVEGTNQKKSDQIAVLLDDMAAQISTQSSNDVTQLSTAVLTEDREKMFSLLFEILTEPSFLDAELERLKSLQQSNLKRIIDDPSSMADKVFIETLFAQKTYGLNPTGNVKSVGQIRRADLLRHYLKFYRPNNMTFVVAGDVDDSFVTQVEEKLGKWEARELPVIDFSQIEIVKSKKVFLNKRDLSQAQIRIGRVGVERNHPDFLKIRAANLILGGAFNSRLNQRVRDQLGLTYSVSSGFDFNKKSGSFVIESFTRNDKLKTTVDEITNVFKEFIDKGVTDEELKGAKALMKGQFPLAIETLDRFSSNVMMLKYYGVPLSYLSDYNKLVDKIRLSDLNQAIKTHFKLEDLNYIIYSDIKNVKSQIDQMGQYEVIEAEKLPL